MDQPILFNNVSHVYQEGTPFEFRALHDVNLEIPAHQITAIVGHTGSGKSTLIQHLNALLRPTHGTVEIEGFTIRPESDNQSLKMLRKKVGVVFQFPESQLFEETVLKDVMFGPLNFGISEEEAERIAREKLKIVGLKEEYYERSPFDLSGGQMRRVAIAGVLALEPEVLVLDEPTAGLDPQGHLEIMDMFIQLNEQEDLTMIMVSHQMDDVARYADWIVVMAEGTLARCGTPYEIFADPDWLSEHQLGLPSATRFLRDLEEHLGRVIHDVSKPPLTVEQLADTLVAYHEGGDQHE